LAGLFGLTSGKEKEPSTRDAAFSKSRDYLAFDPSEFDKSIPLFSIPFSRQAKVWELFELVHERVPGAAPETYCKTWFLKDLENDRLLCGVSSYYRDRNLLEEQGRSLIHAGIKPNSTLRLVRVK